MFRHELAAHLKQFGSAPFLFVGAGLGRRYLGLPDWTGLLRHFADVVGTDYGYYFATANGDAATIASLIAADLHERWWKDPAFEDSRTLYGGKVKTKESGLKVEVARMVTDSLANLSTDPLHVQELDLLRNVVIDGVITTNYDPLPEHVFPNFKVYVGQDELLFADLQGVGETYKIHGSHEEPDSIVLTKADYDDFAERNPYLAAKLLTIFVEHPIIFLGYSLTDPNITTILRSIAKVLTTDRIEQLRDRLIFIQWDPDAGEPTLAGSAVVAEGFTIPVLTATVSDYKDVFGLLGELERKLPARVLRQLKEQVFELVRTNDPKGRLYVQDLTADIDASEVDVVFGVGAIEKLTTSYKGKGRDDLIEDVLADGDLDPERVLAEVVPPFRRDMHVPTYKYLRQAGQLEDDGSLKNGAELDERIVRRVEAGTDPLRPPSGYVARAEAAAETAGDFTTLAANHDPDDVLMYVAMLPHDAIDPEELRQFLIKHRESEYEKGHALRASQWIKGVCLYDWLKYGPRRSGASTERDSPLARIMRAKRAT